MEAFDASGSSADCGTASVPMRSSPAIGASNTRAAVMPQSSRLSSPDAGIGVPNHGSTAAFNPNAVNATTFKTRRTDLSLHLHS